MSIDILTSTAIAGLLPLLVRFFDFLWGKLLTRKRLRQAEETLFIEALRSDSLKTLGDYLDSKVGQFELTEYAEKEEVRHRVDQFLLRIQEFVNPSETERVETIEEPGEVLVGVDTDDPDFQLVRHKLMTTSSWDALATLRRTVELRLVQLAVENRVEVSSKLGIARILNSLVREGVVSPTLADNLRFSVSITNRAIHGEDVSYDEALEAVSHAQHALAELRLLREAQETG